MSLVLNRAFSLIEVALLNLLISSVVIGFCVYESGLSRKQKILKTEAEMQIVNNHLLAFWFQNKYLPCPSFPEENLYQEISYKEARYFNECMPYYGLKKSLSDEYYLGAIPIKNLKLNYDFQTDEFGSKYFYFVRKELVSLDNQFVSIEFIQHKLKSIIWFVPDAEAVTSSQWLIEKGSGEKIINLNNDFQYSEMDNKKAVTGTNLNIALNNDHDYLLMDFSFDNNDKISFAIEDIKIEFEYINGECKFDFLIGIEIFDSISANCGYSNYIGFEYDFEDNSLILAVNFSNVLAIPISFSDKKLNISASDSFRVNNLVFLNKADLSLVNKYFDQPNLLISQDIEISNNDNFKFPDFMILSNLSNRYYSYNLNGKLIVKGELVEKEFKLDNGFVSNKLNFDCEDISVACSVYNNSTDYSILLGSLF